MSDDVADLDPRYALRSLDNKISRLIAPGLTTLDNPRLEPELALAEAIERVDDRTWDVTLRPGLLFSNGLPVTAADVAFTYQSVLDPQFESFHQQGFRERFERVEVLDDRRARFHLTEPVATLWSDLDFGIVSKAATDGRGRFPRGNVVGAGAFRVTRKGTSDIYLERNPFWRGPVPAIPKLRIRTVKDGNARALMLIGGSADLMQNEVRVDLVDDVAARDRVYATSGPSTILSYLMMQGDDPLLNDVRVRRAIAYAIDRDAIIRTRFGGRAVLATGLIAPSHWAYEPDVARYGYDPAKARALLDEAGFSDPDGPGGVPRLSLTYKTSADPFRVVIARIIAAQLAAVGIEVEVRAYEFGTFFADIKRGNYQLASMQSGEIVEPDWYYPYFHSSRIPTPQNLNVHNRWRYANPRVDALIEEGRRTMDRERRMQVYSEIQQILARDVPIIPLWHEDNVALMNVDVQGYRLFPNARLSGIIDTRKR